MVLTGVVILTWEKIFLRPVYAWVERYYPGEQNRSARALVQQRVEHFVISVTVDAVVVTILLAVVRRQQKELSDSEEHYRLLFDSNPEPMWIARLDDHRMVSVNDAALTLYGYERREFLQLTEGDLRSVGEATPLGSPDADEHHRKKDGTVFVAESSSHPIELEGAAGRLVLVRDITQRRAAENSVREMQDHLARNERISALGRAAAQVAHEVKNPLAGLRLYSLHLKSRAEGKLSESEMAMVDKIADGIGRLAVTTEQILNFARPVELKLTGCDLNNLLADILQVLAPQLRENSVEVQTDLCRTPVLVRVDEASMQAALLNLILNGIQAMPTGGRLRVSTQIADKQALIAISDTGCGMSADQVAKIFEPFYTTKSQGLGLGMPFAKKIIEQHSGTIVVTSHPGNGTEITIRLDQ